MSVEEFKPTRFKVWYIHQVPGKAWEAEIDDPDVGYAMLDGIYRAMLFAFDNGQIPDYCNTGGVAYLDPDGDWLDYDVEDWQ